MIDDAIYSYIEHKFLRLLAQKTIIQAREKDWRKKAMTVYEELIDLKYRKNIPTLKLMQRYPKQKNRVREVALLGMPEKTLRKVIQEKKLLNKLLEIKKRFFLKTKRARATAPKKPWFTWW